jgi:hypothetical protein
MPVSEQMRDGDLMQVQELEAISKASSSPSLMQSHR